MPESTGLIHFAKPLCLLLLTCRGLSPRRIVTLKPLPVLYVQPRLWIQLPRTVDFGATLRTQVREGEYHVKVAHRPWGPMCHFGLGHPTFIAVPPHCFVLPVYLWFWGRWDRIQVSVSCLIPVSIQFLRASTLPTLVFWPISARHAPHSAPVVPTLTRMARSLVVRVGVNRRFLPVLSGKYFSRPLLPRQHRVGLLVVVGHCGPQSPRVRGGAGLSAMQ